MRFLRSMLGKIGIGRRTPHDGAGGAGGGGYYAWEGAMQRRTDEDFIPPSIGINALNAKYLPMLRRRCRWLIRNNPHCLHARDVLVRRTIPSTGIWLEPDTGIPELDDQIREYFWPYLEGGVDPGREITLIESQELYLKELISVGEAFNYRPIAAAWRGYPMGPTIEVISAERIDLNHFGGNGSESEGGMRITQGVEYNGARRVAYHVTKDNPDGGSAFGVTFGVPSERRRISAMDAMLSYRTDEAGQVHGVPWAVGAVGTVRNHDRFIEAISLTTIAQSSQIGKVTGAKAPFGKTDPKLGNVPTDAFGRPIVRTEPGVWAFMPQGVDLELTSPPNLGQTLEPLDQVLVRHIAAAFDLDYASLSQDRTKSTFSSDRHGLLDSQEADRKRQALVWNHHTRMWRFESLLWAITSGAIKLKASVRAKVNANPLMLHYGTVIAGKNAWVDPLKEASAGEISRRAGLKTLNELTGGKWMETIDQMAMEEAYERDLRAKLGLPPRNMMGASGAPIPGAGSGTGDVGNGDNTGGDGQDPEDTGDARDDEAAIAEAYAGVQRAPTRVRRHGRASA